MVNGLLAQRGRF